MKGYAEHDAGKRVLLVSCVGSTFLDFTSSKGQELEDFVFGKVLRNRNQSLYGYPNPPERPTYGKNVCGSREGQR